MNQKRIVVIEKDKILKSILELFIEQLGYELLTSFLNIKETIKYIQEHKVDILIIDLNTFDNTIFLKDYVKFIEELEFPILFIGNPSDIEIAKEMINLNIYSFMSKPVTKNILNINIDIACSKHRKIHHSEPLSESCDTSCKVNNKGEIIEYNTSFNSIFNTELDNITHLHLKQIFKDNQDFIKFESSYEHLQISDSAFSIFLHDNQIYEGRIARTSEKDFQICFKTTSLENKLFYENLILKARFNTLFHNSTEAIIIFDSQNNLTHFNQIAKERYLRLMHENLYTGFDFFDVLNFIPRHELQNILDTVRIPAVHQLDRTINIDDKDFNVKIQIAPIYSEEESSINGYILSSTESSTELQLQKEINTLKDELKPVYESTIQRFYLVDMNKKIVSFNQSAFKIIQQEHNHTLKKGDSILKFVPKEIGEKNFEEAFQRVLQGEHLSFKTKIESAIGRYWNEVHYEPIINERGELNRVLIWTLDITESENNLIALNESNKRYELVAKGGNDGLWDWDLETNEVYLSPRWKSLLGYDDDEIENEFGIRDSLTHPDDKQISEQRLKECLNNNDDIFQNEIRLLCKDKNYKWVLERGIILRDDNNKPYRMAGSITDITDRKETENTLLKLNQSLLEERSMFITGNVGIIRVNAKNITEVSYVSKNSEEITGYSQLDFYNGKVPFRDIIHPDDREHHRKEREKAIANNQTHIHFSNYRFIKKNGDIIWLKDFTTIIRDKKGNIVDLLGYFTDITKSKETEIEFEKTQNMFSALWQSVEYETFIVQNDGKILFSRNSHKFSIKALLNNTFFIYDQYESLSEWEKIKDSISIEKTELIKTQIINDIEYQIKITKIDDKQLLIRTNIPLKL